MPVLLSGNVHAVINKGIIEKVIFFAVIQLAQYLFMLFIPVSVTGSDHSGH